MEHCFGIGDSIRAKSLFIYRASNRSQTNGSSLTAVNNHSSRELLWELWEDIYEKEPHRRSEKEGLDAELKLVGEYGLQCKREL